MIEKIREAPLSGDFTKSRFWNDWYADADSSAISLRLALIDLCSVSRKTSAVMWAGEEDGVVWNCHCVLRFQDSVEELVVRL